MYISFCAARAEPPRLSANTRPDMAEKLKTNWYTITAILFFLASCFSLASFWWFRHHMYEDYNFNFEVNEWDVRGQRIRGQMGCDSPSSTQKKWIQLTSFEKTGANILGWTNLSWDAKDSFPASYEKVWSELTVVERTAAESLGHSEGSWDCGRFYYKNQECSKMLWSQPNTSDDGVNRQVWNSRKFLFYSLGFKNHSVGGNTANTYDVVDDFGSTDPVSKHFRRMFIGDMNNLRWLNFALTLAAGVWIFMEIMSVVTWVKEFMIMFKKSPVGRVFTAAIMFFWPFVALLFFASFAHVVLSARITVDALGHPCYFPEAWKLDHLSIELIFWMYASAFGGWLISYFMGQRPDGESKEYSKIDGTPTNVTFGSKAAFPGI
jgi:hypothetical protein